MSAKSNFKQSNTTTIDPSVFNKNENKTRFSLFDNFNVTNLGGFYNKDDSGFKKKVDKLNLRFYLETDKYLNFKGDMEKSQDHLFLLLFKQLSLYVEEIERLNLKIRDKEETEKFNKVKLDEITKRDNLEKDLVYYKALVRTLEKKVFDSNVNEEKGKKENESLKRQVVFYKDKIKLELSGKKDNCFNNNIVNFNLITTPNEKAARAKISLTKDELREVQVKTTNADFNDNYFSIEKVSEPKTAQSKKLDERFTQHLKLSSNFLNDESPFNLTESVFSGKRNISAGKQDTVIEHKKKLANLKGTTASLPPQKKFKNIRVISNSSLTPEKGINKSPFKKPYQNLNSVNSVKKEKCEDESKELEFCAKQKDLNDFALLFRENVEEELELLVQEEDILNELKADLLKMDQETPSNMNESDLKGNSITSSSEVNIKNIPQISNDKNKHFQNISSIVSIINQQSSKPGKEIRVNTSTKRK